MTYRIIAVVVVADEAELEHVVRRVAVDQVLQGARQHDGHRAAVHVSHREVPRVVRLGKSEHRMDTGNSAGGRGTLGSVG